MTIDDLMTVNLVEDELRLLLAGLMEYGGPAAGASVLGPLVGVTSGEAFFALTDRLGAAVRHGQPLSGLDWTRALLLTEICWASDVLGAASEFGSNLSDDRAVTALRSLQRKIVTGARIQALIGGQH